MQLKNYNTYLSIFFVFVIVFLFYIYITPQSHAQSVDQLNQQISSFEERIKAIDKEIEAQKKLIQTTSSRANEIQSQINTLNATRNKLSKEIDQTRDIIKKAELTIEVLDIEITDKQTKLNKTEKALAESIRNLNRTSNTNLLEIIFSSDTITDFFGQIVEIQRFKELLINNKYVLLDLNRELHQKRISEEQTKEELEKEQAILRGQQESILSTQKSQTTLLNQTQSEQSKYEQLLKEKEAQRKQFETLVRDIESQIKRLIDPGSYPSAQNGILVWPADTIRITQLFGGTEFAKNNPGIYGRPYHPGVDFGMPIGTKIKSVASGVVRDFDNTDNYPGCYAWGMWLLIDHDNGLSSLYAHLSSIIVTKGQRVTAGEVVALSGNSGISTGPHLHLTIYATQGVEVGRYGQYRPGGSGCAATNARGPFADLNAYLDPMGYLPKQ